VTLELRLIDSFKIGISVLISLHLALNRLATVSDSVVQLFWSNE